MANVLITQAELAALAGVSRMAVSKACRPGKALHPAVVRKKLDRMHPAVHAYINTPRPVRVPRAAAEAKSRGDAAAAAAAAQGCGHRAQGLARERVAPPPTDTNPLDLLPADIRALVDKPLRELVEIFGTDANFTDWVKAVHEVEKVHALRVKTGKASGELIGRDLVADHVIDPINTLHERLMTDGSKTMASELYAMGRADRTEREFEEYLIDYIGAFVRALKPKLVRAVRRD